MAKYKKGQSGNPAGRPQGTINKVNQEIREKINSFLESNFEKIQADIQGLDPKDRVKFFIELLSFGLPRLKTVEMDVTHDNLITAIELSRDEIKSIAESLERDL